MVFLLSYLALNKAVVYRYQDKIEIAYDQLQIARTYIAQGSSQNELGLWHLEMGYHQLAQMEYSKSYNSFLKAEDIFIRAEKPIELAKTLTGLVLVSQELDHTYPIHQHIKDWIVCLNKIETLQPLLPELHFQHDRILPVIKNAPPDPILNTLLEELEIYKKKLPRLQREIYPDQNQNTLSNDKLSITALGNNQVFLNGKSIRTSEWVHQKTVRELFFYLLTLPRGASKEQIGLVFWPDSSASQLNCQFKNAIYRLRRSIGKDAILFDPNTRSYLFNRDLNYSYDVDEFNSLIMKAEKEIQEQKMIDILIGAVGLYSHPYAPQMDGVWAEPLRQNLCRKYEQALLTIAEFMLKQNRNQDCLDYCRKLLDIEPCQEKAYQLCMKAYSNIE